MQPHITEHTFPFRCKAGYILLADTGQISYFVHYALRMYLTVCQTSNPTTFCLMEPDQKCNILILVVNDLISRRRRVLTNHAPTKIIDANKTLLHHSHSRPSFPHFDLIAQVIEMGPFALEAIPTELILGILDSMQLEDILNMGKVCRRLNLIAIPYFLGKMGSPKPEATSVVKASSRRYKDELAALSIHFSLTKIDHLFCIISHRQDLEETFIPPSHIYWLTISLIRTNHMLSRLTSIGSFSLIIDSWGSGWSLRSDVAQKFMASVLEVTETAILKSCQSLQILHCHPTSAERVYNFKLVEKDKNPSLVKTTLLLVPRLLSHTRRTNEQNLVGKGWKYESLSSSTSLQLWKSPWSHSQLTHLDLDTEFLLIPPCSSWTFDIWKRSPIVCLSISFPSIITKDEFHHFLFPNLAKSLPNLRELNCAFYDDFLVKTVIEHLHFFPFLETFRIALSFTAELSLPPPTFSKPTTLRHLVSFTGSPDQAAYFFSNRNLLFPNMKNINLISDIFYQDQSSPTDYYSIADNIRFINERMLEMKVVPNVNLCFSNHGELPDDTSPSELDDAGLHWIHHFRTISLLTFNLYPPPSHDSYDSESLHRAFVSRALIWLDIFRGVKYLTLIIKRDSIIEEESLKIQLLTTITAAHPQLLMVNAVFLSREPRKYHYHWSNACDDLERGTGDIPTTPSYNKKSRGSFVCSHFWFGHHAASPNYIQRDDLT